MPVTLDDVVELGKIYDQLFGDAEALNDKILDLDNKFEDIQGKMGALMFSIALLRSQVEAMKSAAE